MKLLLPDNIDKASTARIATFIAQDSTMYMRVSDQKIKM